MNGPAGRFELSGDWGALEALEAREVLDVLEASGDVVGFSGVLGVVLICVEPCCGGKYARSRRSMAFATRSKLRFSVSRSRRRGRSSDSMTCWTESRTISSTILGVSSA